MEYLLLQVKILLWRLFMNIKSMLTFILISTATMSAQWYWQNPLPQGNNLSSIKFVDKNNGWALGSSSTFLRTTNGGVDWVPLPNIEGKTITDFSFVDANNGYAVANDSSFLKTTNGGSDWLIISSVDYVKFICIDFLDANSGWAIVRGNNMFSFFLRTTDGGLNWTMLWKDDNVNYASTYFSGIKCIDVNNVWAYGRINGAYSFIVRTTDGGINWSEYRGMTKTNSIDASFVDQNNGWYVLNYYGWGVITRTTDGGKTWDSLISPYYEKTILGICFIDKSNGWAVGGSGTILHSTDGGITWIKQESGTTVDLFKVLFTDINNGYAIGAGGAILHTSDGGENWINQMKGATNGLRAVAFSDTLNGWTVGNSGTILHTTNGGTNWIIQNSNTANTLTSLAVVDSNNVWIVGSDPNSKNTTILHTSDAGITWINQWKYPQFYYSLVKIIFTDKNNGWTVGPGGAILHTSDGGLNWDPQSSPTSNYFYDISFSDSNNGWIVGDHGTILNTTNGGTNWVDKSIIPGRYYSICFKGNIGWITGDGGKILKTTDKGLTWITQPTPSGLYSITKVFFLDSNLGWLNTSHFTTNGGVTWEIQNTGATNTLNDLFFIDPHHGWAVGNYGNIISTTPRDIDASTSVTTTQLIPPDYKLYQNYPNPFNPTTTIKYSIPVKTRHGASLQRVTLKVYDLLGREIETLVNEEKLPGNYEVKFDGSNLTSGVYFYRLQAGSFSETKKFVLMK